jgi:diguanylate cyclase (GGDEF)-like protein
MTDKPDILNSALDEVDYGFVVLDDQLSVRFVNRAFTRMWDLPAPPEGSGYAFTDMLENARRAGLYETSRNSIKDYVQPGKAWLRLADGRVLKFKCKALPDGGRMMSFEDITGFVNAIEQLRELAAIDDLTKLLTRRQFMEGLQKEFKRAKRYDLPLSLLTIDADNFKRINDRYGHPVGDEVLRVLADKTRGILRGNDLVGRLGGEEFVAALIQTDMVRALQTAERLRSNVAAASFQVGGSAIAVTISIGVAGRGPEHENAAELLRLADEALYSAKRAGRNRVVATAARLDAEYGTSFTQCEP